MAGSVLQVAYGFPFFLDEELDEIFRAHQKVHFKKGETILREGEKANEYFILEKGLARSFVNDFKGNEVTTPFFTENESLSRFRPCSGGSLLRKKWSALPAVNAGNWILNHSRNCFTNCRTSGNGKGMDVAAAVHRQTAFRRDVHPVCHEALSQPP